MSIVLNTKTYNPDGFDTNGVSLYTERSSGIPTGFGLLTFGQTRSDLYYKNVCRMSVPIIATEDSDCSCAGTVLRTYRVRIEFEEPVSGVSAERIDILDRVQDLVLTTQFVSFITNLIKPTT